jgi:ribosomal protein L37AE/L43A
MRHQYEKEEVEMKLEEFIHRYQYTQQVKEIIWKKYGQNFHPYCKDKANKRYSEAIWEYITE